MNNKMWQIPLDIQDGEHEYTEYIYFFGTQEDAQRYGESYVTDYFGKDTVNYGDDDWYYNHDGTLAVHFGRAWEFNGVTAMTAKGACCYKVDFSFIKQTSVS
jgi:hypothetical protein